MVRVLGWEQRNHLVAVFLVQAGGGRGEAWGREGSQLTLGFERVGVGDEVPLPRP